MKIVMMTVHLLSEEGLFGCGSDRCAVRYGEVRAHARSLAVARNSGPRRDVTLELKRLSSFGNPNTTTVS